MRTDRHGIPGLRRRAKFLQRPSRDAIYEQSRGGQVALNC
jgi:hypothetical protein